MEQANNFMRSNKTGLAMRPNPGTNENALMIIVILLRKLGGKATITTEDTYWAMSNPTLTAHHSDNVYLEVDMDE